MERVKAIRPKPLLGVARLPRPLDSVERRARRVEVSTAAGASIGVRPEGAAEFGVLEGHHRTKGTLMPHAQTVRSDSPSGRGRRHLPSGRRCARHWSPSMASASSFTLRVEKNVHVTNDPTKAFRVKAVEHA